MVRDSLAVIFATVVAIGFTTGTAGAQNLDINELAAAVALPVITGGQPPNTLKLTVGDILIGNDNAINLLTITNGRAVSTVLKIDVISGDPNGPLGGDQWQSDSFDCLLTGRETVTFLVIPNGLGSIIYGECSTPLANDGVFANRVFFGADAANGVFFAAAANPVGAGNLPPAISEDILLADAVVIDVVLGQAYSFGAIPFQAGTGANDGNKVYRFDGLEYSKWPAAVATNFIAPDVEPFPNRIIAELILFTLDGSTSALAPPRVSVAGLGYDDDEVSFDFDHTFDCFDIVSLGDLSQNFTQFFLGSLSGHLTLLAQQVGSGATDSHDATFGDGNNSRRRPVHGWIVQGVLAGAAVVLPGQPTALPAPPGQPNAIQVPGFAAWGRSLSQGRTGLVPFLTDQDPVLNSDPNISSTIGCCGYVVDNVSGAECAADGFSVPVQPLNKDLVTLTCSDPCPNLTSFVLPSGCTLTVSRTTAICAVGNCSGTTLPSGTNGT